MWRGPSEWSGRGDCDLATGGVLGPDRNHPCSASTPIGPPSGLGAAGPIGSTQGEGIELQRRVAEGYDEVARRHPERIRVIDGDAERGTVHAAVLAEVQAVTA